MKIEFKGFPQQGITFLRDLRLHNNREWFETNKMIYKEAVEAPAKAFLREMCIKLELIAKGPVEGKIFRIYRDVRFSKDKTPYNTHVRMGFSAIRDDTTGGCSSESPKFYFSLEPDQLVIGCGIFDFGKEILKVYRDAVIDVKKGSLLIQIVEDLESKNLRMGDPEYKRIPQGYDKNHPRADLLRHKGLAVWQDFDLPRILSTNKAVEFCFKHYKDMLPLYRWLETL